VRWLVTGGGGMLATDVQKALVADGHEVLVPSREGLDITNPDACTDLASGCDVVFNCAAWTAVDDAESQEDAAFAVNAMGAANLARAARSHDALLVHVSTDYVFNGSASSPYDEDAPLAPRSVYGRTKAAGEWAVRGELPDRHLILRTAWLYGEHGSCFPRTITRLLRERGSVSVVEDQVGQPTWTRDVADVGLRLVAAGATGTYHATASGRTSWHGFAAAAARSASLDPSAVSPADSSEFPRPAPRPEYSVLGHDKFNAIGVEPIADWQERWTLAAGEVLASR
jgi:dTDP-4-dehydrorhamnose reductase